MSSDDASGIVECNLGIFRLLSIKNGPGFPRMLCDVRCFQFDLVMMHLLQQEGVMSVFEEFNSSELNRTRSRYSFSSEKLVIFENSLRSIHWRTAWTDLSKTVIQWIDAELIVKEYGFNLFSFLHSVFHNCPEKRLIGFFCSWVYIQNQY